MEAFSSDRLFQAPMRLVLWSPCCLAGNALEGSIGLHGLRILQPWQAQVARDHHVHSLAAIAGQRRCGPAAPSERVACGELIALDVGATHPLIRRVRVSFDSSSSFIPPCTSNPCSRRGSCTELMQLFPLSPPEELNVKSSPLCQNQSSDWSGGCYK